MLPSTSLKVTLDRKLTAMVHFQGDEGGTVRIALSEGHYSTGTGRHWPHQQLMPDFKTPCVKNMADVVEVQF